jgi:hypothetical protein
METNNLIDTLNEINASRAYEVYVPSIKSNLKFKPLIIAQFSDFVDTVAKNSYFDLGFQQELTNTIRKNIITDNFDVNTLTELDKLCIALKIRINDISSTYNDKDISSKIDEIKALNHPDLLEIEEGGIKVVCKVPNLLTEENYISYSCNTLDQEVTDVEALKSILNIIFVAELSKYIDSIVVDANTYTQENNKENWIPTISTLPVSILNRVISYIDSIKQIKTKLLTIDENSKIDYDLRLFTT